MNYLKSLWAYRGFIVSSIEREFQSKYRNSLLGALWTVINPLAMITVYTVIFSQVMRTKLPGLNSEFGYSIYLCSGILSWGLFSEVVVRLQNIFLENANLLKKVSFPRLCLPVVAVGSAGLNFLIIFGIFTVFLIFSGSFPGVVFVALMPLLGITVALAVGIGITLGILNVFYRDIGQFFGIFIQFWFWLTPIVYPVKAIPERIQNFMIYNPMAPVISGFQSVMANGQWPDWQSQTYPALLGFILCLFGLRLFRRHAGDVVDEL